ncbi:hypothetical protein [Lacrimispora sp.]|nr:hypothetical protein [Lacrimispora sp.]MDR7813890.1 hypothetical protein [Lacrimispora sp.]
MYSEVGQTWVNAAPVSTLEMWIYEGTQKLLLINDGRIVGCEEEE